MHPFETKELLLAVSGVSKSYDVPILNNINFEIRNISRPDKIQGQIVSLIGKSGSGKSTLFRIIAALEKPDGGEVHRCSGIVSEEHPEGEMVPIKEGDVGVVFQNSYIYDWRSVKSLLSAAVARNKALTNKEEYMTHLAEQLDIVKLYDKFPKTLSGGQKQRVAIAEQILNGSELILLDEPFSGLDTLAIDKVTNMITAIVNENERKTFIVISHDLSNSLAISDTAFILSKPNEQEPATITHKIDLAIQGLAWQPDIKENTVFRDLLKQVKSLL